MKAAQRNVKLLARETPHATLTEKDTHASQAVSLESSQGPLSVTALSQYKRGEGVLLTEIPLPRIARQGTGCLISIRGEARKTRSSMP